jgi:hypothetical protein
MERVLADRVLLALLSVRVTLQAGGVPLIASRVGALCQTS